MIIDKKEADFMGTAIQVKSLSSAEKADVVYHIPKKVRDNIKTYPESPFHQDKSWKVVNFEENLDGSAAMRFVKDDENLNTPEVRYGGIVWFPDDKTFNMEKEQHAKGILKEISERTVEMHIANGTFAEEHLNKIEVVSRLGKKLPLSNVAEVKSGVLKLK